MLLQIWDTCMIGASADEVMALFRHLQGGSRRCQTWAIVGKHIEHDGDQG